MSMDDSVVTVCSYLKMIIYPIRRKGWPHIYHVFFIYILRSHLYSSGVFGRSIEVEIVMVAHMDEYLRAWYFLMVLINSLISFCSSHPMDIENASYMTHGTLLKCYSFDKHILWEIFVQIDHPLYIRTWHLHYKCFECNSSQSSTI